MPAPMHRLELPGRPTLAVEVLPGSGPTILFLPGFGSTMTGSKATALMEDAARSFMAMARFDYRGRGASAGGREDGGIGEWRDDALAVLDHLVKGPTLLVGSSMGGWIALLVALARPERVQAIVGIAAAPDFTADLIRPSLSPAARDALASRGVWYQPSDYGAPLPITRHLLEEGERHLLLRDRIAIRCPVHLLHGQLDPDVPWSTALALAGRLESAAVTVELVKDGDHRLSRPEDLRRIWAAITRLADQTSARSPSR